MDKKRTREKRKVIVVLPAYNAGRTLERTVENIPYEIVDEIILVDDKSQDNTVQIAKKMGLTVYEHKRNRGYGANQKTCYTIALKSQADIIVMLHPDYQYDPACIKPLVEPLIENMFDVMLGSRIRSWNEARAGGMPLYKYLGNRALTIFENLVSGQTLSEWHTGMRAYSREVLKGIDFLNSSDDFVFDTQILFRIVERGYRIGEIPVPVRYFPEASTIDFMQSVMYGIETMLVSFGFFIKRRINKKYFNYIQAKIRRIVS